MWKFLSYFEEEFNHVTASFAHAFLWSFFFCSCFCVVFQDGRVLCSSMPTYGQGKEAGNEAGYIVGMSTCYPQPGSVKINVGETLILESNYSSAQRHTGVMGLFYILVADQLPKPRLSLRVPIAKQVNKV